MSIFSRTLVIVAISAPAVAIGNPGYYYYPSYYPPYDSHKQISPPDSGESLGVAKLHVLEYNKRPNTATPTQAASAYAPPPYVPPVYSPPMAHKPPTYDSPAVSTLPTQNFPVVGGDQAPNPPEVPTLADNPPIEYTAPTQASYNPPAGYNPAYSPEYAPTYNEPTPPKWGNGKPSPLPNSYDRRNAPRVARTKIGRKVKATLPKEGHARRFPFLKKRQQVEQHTIVPVTVNMISVGGHASSTSGTLTTTTANALQASPSPSAPGIKVDTQDSLSNSAATMSSSGVSLAPVPSYWEGQHHANLDGGESAPHRNKASVVASVLSIIVGLMVLVTVVKLTSNALRRRKHPAGLGKYEEHLSSKEGLIPDMCDKVHFDAHDVIVTCPDGSEMSPLSSSRGSSRSPPPHSPRVMASSLPPTPMPTFAPPPTPTSPLAMPYVKLLSPTVNLAQQNLVQNRASETSETMSVSTTTTDISVRRSASYGEGLGRLLSHRRMRSAPESVVWSARSSRATGKFTSGISGDEGYWDSVDVSGSESVSQRSVAMSVMW